MKKTILTALAFLSTFVAGANAASTLTNGLVAYYQFSGNVNDSSGLGNTGTGFNVLYTADRYGVANSALLLNGSNAYLQYPDSVYGPATPGFTWSLWVQPNSLTPGNVMNHGAFNGESGLGWTGSGYGFGVKLASSDWQILSPVTTGSGLVHIVCVYEQGVQAAIWIDGQLGASMTIPNENLFVLDPSYPNYSSIGSYLSDEPTNNFFSGVIDDVRIYNRALSTSEIQELFTVEQVTPWPNAADLGSGWVWSSWFGSVNLDCYPWAYHAQHGWMYLFGTDPSNLWIYNTSDNMGFLWTSSSVYPWLWSNTEHSWLYYEEGTQNPRWFFNWNNRAWEQHNP